MENSNEIPILQANISVVLSDSKTAKPLDTMFYASEVHIDGYQFPFAPEEIKGRPFKETMQVFHTRDNKVKGELSGKEIVFSVEGIDYGRFSDKLAKKKLHTITLNEYVQAGMPDSIDATIDDEIEDEIDDDLDDKIDDTLHDWRNGVPKRG